MASPPSPPSPTSNKRKRDAEDEDEEEGLSVLQRMYFSKRWTDLAIETPTTTFHVHKAVVCEVFPFIDAACTIGFIETQTSHIKLPEDAAVVEAILQRCYDVKVDLLKEAADQEVLKDKALSLIKLRIAFDKYDVQDTFEEVNHGFGIAMIGVQDPRVFIEVGLAAFAQCGEHMNRLKDFAAWLTFKRIGSIRDDHEAWKLLCSDPQYMGQTLDLCIQ